MIRHYLLSFLMLFLGLNFMFANQVDEIEKTLNKQLAASTTTRDSIRILYDLFDLVPRKEKIPYGKMLYSVATRESNDKVRLDILRQLSQLTGSMIDSDSVYKYLGEEVAKIPRSQEQEETAVFLRMRQLSGEARSADAKHIESSIAMLISEESKAKSYPLNLRVIRLFAIVEFLTNSGVEGDLLGEYVDMLKERMGQANFKLYALNNILLTESANIYTTIGNQKEAVKADKELLEVISKLEKKYHSEGRKYRNYAPNKYIIYRRMLGNYAALTPEEIEEYYAQIQKLMKEDEDVAKTEGRTQLAELCYSMATKNYVAALPIIRKTLEKEKRPAKRRRLVQWMQTAAAGIEDKDTEIEALKLYNAMLIERDTSSTSDRARELDIRTRVNELKADKAYLQVEIEKEEKESVERMMSFVMIGWVIFAIILIIMLFVWTKYRLASVRIRQFVDNLDNEVHYLKDQHYYDYMHSHPYSHGIHSHNEDKKRIDLDNRKVVDRRKRKRGIIQMLNYVLNDILYISSIGKIGRGKFTRPFSVTEVVEDEAAKAIAKKKPVYEINIVLPEKDIEMRSDKECLEYVLRHVFYAADRISDNGVVTLEVKENEKTGRVDFIFTNSGVVVPEGNEDVMFDNFIDVSDMIDRDDSGLFIARLSALLIDSSLYLDKGFKEGSRYVFSLSKIMGK